MLSRKNQQTHSQKFPLSRNSARNGCSGEVYVQFVIAKDGSITGVRMRGPDKNLEKEAARIISKLPRMTQETAWTRCSRTL